MLLTEDDLLDKLDENLKDATKLDIAVAWLGPGKACEKILNFARKRPGAVRAIIGISGNSTHPSSLQNLNGCAEIRIPVSDPLFHPKVFVFYGSDSTWAWVGSANLTRCGFERNKEIVAVIRDDQSYKDWFEGCWAQLPQCPNETIENYVRTWKPPSRAEKYESTHTEQEAKIIDYEAFKQLIVSVKDWPSYVQALNRANFYWSERLGITIDGEFRSWLNTITLGNAIIRRSTWEEFSEHDYHVLMGLEVDADNRGIGAGFGLLGSMKGAGKARNIFKERTSKNLALREKIRSALQQVLDVSHDKFLTRSNDFILMIENEDGMGIGIATRFLALARPDFAVSVNNGSREALSDWTSLSSTALGRAQKNDHSKRNSYASLLAFLAKQPWYIDPRPRGARERALADARAALLDCLLSKRGEKAEHELII